MFNHWVCKKCWKAKPWWRMQLISCYVDVYSYSRRIHLCKSCYENMIVYPTGEALKEYK